MKVMLIEDVQHIEKEAHQVMQGAAGVPLNHLADAGSDTFEEELFMEHLENEENLVYEIEESLQRIAKGDYGICLGCEKKIPKARLEAIPYAQYCVACKEEMEKERKVERESPV